MALLQLASGGLTLLAAESAPNTSERCWPNTLPRCRHGLLLPCGAAWSTTLSTSGCINPSSIARISGTHTTAAAATTRKRTRIRPGRPYRTPAAGAVKGSSREKHRLEEEAAQVEALRGYSLGIAHSVSDTRGRVLGMEHRDARVQRHGGDMAATWANTTGAKAIVAPQSKRNCCFLTMAIGVTRCAMHVAGGGMTRHSGPPGHPQVTSAGFTRAGLRKLALMVGMR
jgi:hypothetical protein